MQFQIAAAGEKRCDPVGSSHKRPLKFLFPVLLLNVHACVYAIAYMCGCTQRPEATPSVIFHNATYLVHLSEPP